MPGANQYRAQEFIDAIKDTGGIITSIARKVGCSWHTAKKYIVNYPTVAKAYADETESVIDLAEVKLIEAIKAADLSAVKFYLTTKGRGRGYVQKQEMEVTGKDGGPLVPVQHIIVEVPKNEQ